MGKLKRIPPFFGNSANTLRLEFLHQLRADFVVAEGAVQAAGVGAFHGEGAGIEGEFFGGFVFDVFDFDGLQAFFHGVFAEGVGADDAQRHVEAVAGDVVEEKFRPGASAAKVSSFDVVGDAERPRFPGFRWTRPGRDFLEFFGFCVASVEAHGACSLVRRNSTALRYQKTGNAKRKTGETADG